MSEPTVASLLHEAADEGKQVRRHLLVAAAIGLLVGGDSIVVGGTAEEYWTRDAYHPTDLDICAPVSRSDERRLRDAGFDREGRHWFHPGVPTVAVEFPDSVIDGDPSKAITEHVGGADVKVIGVDDLYLDRLRQLTANPTGRSREYMSAMAIVSARYEDLDYDYIERRLEEVSRNEPKLVEQMRSLDRRINREARKRITE
ncbi:MAG TPA: hypothetical protein VGB64_13360 [Actinomycetota bacterium]